MHFPPPSSSSTKGEKKTSDPNSFQVLKTGFLRLFVIVIMLCVLWSAFILSKGDIFICHSHLKEFFEAAFRHSIQFIIGFNWDQEREIQVTIYYLWPDYYFSKSKMRLQGDVFKHCVTTQKTSVIVKVLQKTYIFVKGKNVTHLGANRDQLNLTNPLEWHRAFFSVRETPLFNS